MFANYSLKPSLVFGFSRPLESNVCLRDVRCGVEENPVVMYSTKLGPNTDVACCRNRVV